MIRLTCVFIVLAGLSARAGVREGTFENTMTVGDTVLARAGAGSLSRWFIKGCDIALFVAKGTKKSEVLDDRARALEFSYYVGIEAEQFATAAWDTLKKNFRESELKERKRDIDKLHTFYRTVESGDRYRLVYEPGAGTTLFLNEKKLGTVKGQEFARTYFSVWLGEVPIDRGLKKRLTGGLK
jgi:hypothetical protein